MAGGNRPGQYADAFEANDIEMDLLKQVDDQVLKDIEYSVQDTIAGRQPTVSRFSDRVTQ